MPRTKGVGLINVRRYVTECFGQDGWEQVTTAMSEEDRNILPSVVTMGWYDVALYARLLATFDEVLGCGDLSLLPDLGRYGAQRDFTTIHRVFLRLANPAYAIEKIGSVWPRYYDSGRWEIERKSETEVAGTLHDLGISAPALCVEMTAYMAKVLELVGARDVFAGHPSCRGRGDQHCLYTMKWR